MTVPLPRHNRVLLACLIFCLATLVVSHVSGFIGLDECHMDSLENGYAKGDVWLSAMRYLQFDLFCVFALAVTLALHDRHVLPLFDIAVAWIWYQSTYNILAAAKCWLGDTRCHKKGFANSVSGHFHFHVFALWTMFFLIVRLRRNPMILHNYANWTLFQRIVQKKTRWTTNVIAILLCLFIGCSGVTLYRTWFWGYHTLRQILYGCVFGLFDHTVWSLFYGHHVRQQGVLDQKSIRQRQWMILILLIHTVFGILVQNSYGCYPVGVLTIIMMTVWAVVLTIAVWMRMITPPFLYRTPSQSDLPKFR
eukprot:TRINITY_DN49609_c0_g1_i2.p1 TRINITY_DN49609_c0_g1~~TRINITY_DN49609_c0_g1_i2.p1  ORF type:complete len:321 (+),score=34.95 TRINITY_DN49609_c0_g1_i2:44-964(+)